MQNCNSLDIPLKLSYISEEFVCALALVKQILEKVSLLSGNSPRVVSLEFYVSAPLDGVF